jgi:radical SAM protein with 4Fe4S-binding SPASM domain
MYTPQRGRYVIASRDIDVGECLIHEEAIINIVKFQDSLSHCHFCQKDTSVHPLPCKRCSAVVFCSPECRQKADPG